MSERALEDQPGRRKFKRIYGSKQRKSGLQGKTEHRKRERWREGLRERRNPELGCAGLRLHLPLSFPHSGVSAPTEQSGTGALGACPAQPQLCAPRPRPARPLLTRLQEAGLRVTCPVLLLLPRTGGSDWAFPSQRAPTPQDLLAAGLCPGPSHPRVATRPRPTPAISAPAPVHSRQHQAISSSALQAWSRGAALSQWASGAKQSLSQLHISSEISAFHLERVHQ